MASSNLLKRTRKFLKDFCPSKNQFFLGDLTTKNYLLKLSDLQIDMLFFELILSYPWKTWKASPIESKSGLQHCVYKVGNTQKLTLNKMHKYEQFSEGTLDFSKRKYIRTVAWSHKYDRVPFQAFLQLIT